MTGALPNAADTLVDEAPAGALAEAPGPENGSRPPWPRAWLAWWRSRGVATQGTVPGAYAWAITVAPAGWSSGASAVAMSVTALGLGSLIAGPLVERKSPLAAQLVVGWGVVLSAVATWVLSPAASLESVDAARGIAGMLGWGLFAFAIASPARAPVSTLATTARASRRAGSRVFDRVVLSSAIACAVALEVPGWRMADRERGLLVRLVAVAGGLGIMTAAGAVVVGHRPRQREGASVRLPRMRPASVVWVAAGCLLMGAGAAYALWLAP
jgi:hypothetical protein